MRTKLCTISFVFSFFLVLSQNVSNVYKIDGLLRRIAYTDTTYILNFWATWCKPCVEELRSFDSLYQETKNDKIKIILVCLDFKEELEKKVKPFLKKKGLRCECVLLDEINGNDFINKISDRWSGAIPGTLLKHGERSEFVERKITLSELEKQISILK